MADPADLEDLARRAGAGDTAALDELLADGVEVKKYGGGDILFKEGDPPDGLYLIRRGLSFRQVARCEPNERWLMARIF